MNEIQIFSNPQFGEIRTAMDDNGEPLFCLADICASLGISNHRNVKALMKMMSVWWTPLTISEEISK